MPNKCVFNQKWIAQRCTELGIVYLIGGAGWTRTSVHGDRNVEVFSQRQIRLAMSRRLLKFSGGSVDDYATFSTSTASPSS